MKIRVLILTLSLIVRCVLGWLTTLDFNPGEKIRLTGNINNIYHKDSKCVIKIARFLVLTENICAFEVDGRIRVIGTIDTQVIDSLNGNLWLRDAKIDVVKQNELTTVAKTGNSSWLDYFRSYLVSRFKSFMPEPEAGLVAGVVLGYKKDIGQDFYQEMIKSGTIHIAVASGYNILLVGGSVLSICFYFLKRKWATLVAILVMIFYAVLSGGEAPVVRALWMAGLLFIGKVIGRSTQTTWILALTVWVMLIVDLSMITSVSFQLSVMASVGLMMVEPRLSKYLQIKAGSGLSNFLSGLGITTTLSTMLTTMPVLWWHFDRVSLIGILSNTLILPLIPILMVGGVVMLLIPWLVVWPVYAIAHWIVLVIKFFGS